MPRDQSTTQSKIGPNPTNTLKSRLANFLFGDIISQATSHAVREAAAAISVRVDDGPEGLGLGLQPLAASGPHDGDYTEWLQMVVRRRQANGKRPLGFPKTLRVLGEFIRAWNRGVGAFRRGMPRPLAILRPAPKGHAQVRSWLCDLGLLRADPRSAS